MSLNSRVSDVSSEDGEVRGGLHGIFHAGLPVQSFEASLAGLAATYPKLGPKGVLFKKAQRKARQIEDDFPDLSIDESSAIVLYTMEDDEVRENSPYFLMNKALRDKDRRAALPWRDYIWLLLHALKLLPPSRESVVFRGCKGKSLSELGLQVKPGKEVVWSGFSSTATTVDVMNTFPWLQIRCLKFRSSKRLIEILESSNLRTY